MSVSTAIIGKGTVLSFCATSGGTYTPIAELTDVKPPKITADKADVTRYDSPNGAKERIPGWIDGGDVEFEINYTKAQKVILHAQVAVMNFWKIIYPDTLTEAFQGFIDSLEGEIPNENKISSKAKVCVTGLPTFTPAA